MARWRFLPILTILTILLDFAMVKLIENPIFIRILYLILNVSLALRKLAEKIDLKGVILGSRQFSALSNFPFNLPGELKAAELQL